MSRIEEVKAKVKERIQDAKGAWRRIHNVGGLEMYIVEDYIVLFESSSLQEITSDNVVRVSLGKEIERYCFDNDKEKMVEKAANLMVANDF